MGSNVSFSRDGRGVIPFDRFVREVRVPDSAPRFEAPATLPTCLAQHDNPADEGRKYGEFTGIIGTSPALRFALDQVRRVAPTTSTVLIEGETGVAKSVLLRPSTTSVRGGTATS